MNEEWLALGLGTFVWLLVNCGLVWFVLVCVKLKPNQNHKKPNQNQTKVLKLMCMCAEVTNDEHTIIYNTQ
jgi:hypothetical protein